MELYQALVQFRDSDINPMFVKEADDDRIVQIKKVAKNTWKPAIRNKKTVKRFVTLSPCTEMARKFHLQNGAIELRQNEWTVNYEYL